MRTERQKCIAWKGLNYRPERADADPVYRLVFAFLEKNPQFTFAKLIDLSLAQFFSSQPDAAAVARLLNLKLKPDFSFLEELE